MLHKCANPACPNPFRKLSQGKLFLVETESPEAATSGRAAWATRAQRRIEHFWLCDECASILTLSFDPGRGMITVPLSTGPKFRPQSVALQQENTDRDKPELALRKGA